MTHLRKIMLEDSSAATTAPGRSGAICASSNGSRNTSASQLTSSVLIICAVTRPICARSDNCVREPENHVAALWCFFIRTCTAMSSARSCLIPRCARSCPNILSREEVAYLIEASSSLSQRTLLMVLYGIRHAAPRRTLNVLPGRMPKTPYCGPREMHSGRLQSSGK